MNLQTFPSELATDPIGGTAEETHLTVKRLGSGWVIEDNLGQSVGSGPEPEPLVEVALSYAAQRGLTGIRVQNPDGTIQRVLHPQ